MKFVTFVIYLYVPWWYTTSFTEDAPVNDFKLFRKLYNYPDESVASSVISSFSNHTWYLTEELILLALFSEEVDAKEKQDIVTKLNMFEKAQSFTKRHGSGFAKPILPKVTKNCTSLSEFVGESSWYFLSFLGIDCTFLDLPVEMWHDTESFVIARKIVKNIRCVNDIAERGVKLASDFISTAKINSRFQNVLQVVENERNRIPNQRKKHKPSRRWYLYN